MPWLQDIMMLYPIRTVVPDTVSPGGRSGSAICSGIPRTCHHSGAFNRLKEKLKDDRGSAIVLVIIAIAFVGTLVAMLVYMVYFNYLMKYNGRKTTSAVFTICLIFRFLL